MADGQSEAAGARQRALPSLPFEPSSFFISTSIFVVLLIVCIGAIVEVASRDLLRSAVERERIRILELSYSIRDSNINALEDSETFSDVRIQALNESVPLMIDCLNRVVLDLNRLNAFGLRGSGEEASDIYLNLRNCTNLDIYMGAPSTDPSEDSYEVFFDLMILRGFPVEPLIFMVALSASAIGAIISGLRNEKTITFRDIAIGLGAGFIVMLAIKGGGYVLFLNSNIENVPVNVYGIAFSGVLVGMFTERAYKFLGRILDEIERKLNSVLPSATIEKGGAEEARSTRGAVNERREGA